MAANQVLVCEGQTSVEVAAFCRTCGRRWADSEPLVLVRAHARIMKHHVTTFSLLVTDYYGEDSEDNGAGA